MPTPNPWNMTAQTNPALSGGLLSTAVPPAVPNTVVNTATPTPSIQAPTMTATGYAPTQRTVDAGTETVQGQMQGLMRSDNPLIEQARTGANQQMNSRGLLNSSMAVQASDQAAYNAALPIAQADANIYGTASQQNMATQNEALRTNASFANDAGKLNLGAEMDTLKSNLDTATKVRLTNIEADYKTLIQTSASAGEIYKGTLSAIANITADPNMTAASKATAMNGLFSRMGVAMNLIGSINGVDVSGLLDFGTVTP